MTLVVVGTGRLARAVCYSLSAMAHLLPPAQRVVVVGRRPGPAEELCYVASARAAASSGAAAFAQVGGSGGVAGGAAASGASGGVVGAGTAVVGAGVRFEPVVVDVADGAAVADVLGAAAPEGVLLCASTQSPWERLSAPSAWTALVGQARFGVTLPFQAEQALRVASATPAGAWFVNACFPDAVNPLLAELGVPVLCGAGNVGLLAASAQAALGLPDQRRLRLVAHHLHLHPPAGTDGDALAWLDDEPLDSTPLLAGLRAAARDELNHVTGHTTAMLLAALLTGAELHTSLPGPLGLPGGYPVTVNPASGGGRVWLRLPAGITRDEAVAHNQRWALADGAVVDGGRVRFGDAARAELARVAPDLADGFAATDLPAVAARMHQLRDELRDQPGDR